MAAAVAIYVIPVAEPTGLTFAMSHKLGTPKLDEGSKALRSRFQGKESVRRQGDGTHTSTWLSAVGVGTCEGELLAVLASELVLEPVHGGNGCTVLLKECEVCWSACKALSMTFKVGNIFALNHSDARLGYRQGWFGWACQIDESMLLNIGLRLHWGGGQAEMVCLALSLLKSGGGVEAVGPG